MMSKICMYQNIHPVMDQSDVIYFPCLCLSLARYINSIFNLSRENFAEKARTSRMLEKASLSCHKVL